MMSIVEAIHDENLFKPLFRDLRTWAAWIVFLKALFALEMTADELTLYQTCTGRENAPTIAFREAWLPIGRRSGKSFIAALLAVFLAVFRDYRDYLSPGERGCVFVIASDRAQAAVILRYVKGFIAAIPMIHRMVENDRAESIDLSNHISIMIVTCSYKSVRGPTAVAVIADEVAFWRADDGRNPATEVLRALRPALATIPGAILLGISSPYSRSGPLWTAFNEHYGKDDSDVLVWHSSSTVMNPTISQKLIDREMAADPEAARAEWLAEFRSDLEAYLPIEAIEAVTVQDRFELPALPDIRYTAFVDPSGGRRDPAALAIGHVDKEQRVIVDVARRFKAPHDPAQVTQEMAELLTQYRIKRVKGDRYAGAWPEQEFLKFGITYQAADQDKSCIYIDFIPLVLSGRVELLDNKQLFAELRALERRTRRGGKDLVDHPPKAHDDLANAVAGVCVELGILGREPGIFVFIREEAKRLKEKEVAHV